MTWMSAAALGISAVSLALSGSTILMRREIDKQNRETAELLNNWPPRN